MEFSSIGAMFKHKTKPNMFILKLFQTEKVESPLIMAFPKISKKSGLAYHDISIGADNTIEALERFREMLDLHITAKKTKSPQQSTGQQAMVSPDNLPF